MYGSIDQPSPDQLHLPSIEYQGITSSSYKALAQNQIGLESIIIYTKDQAQFGSGASYAVPGQPISCLPGPAHGLNLNASAESQPDLHD